MAIFNSYVSLPEGIMVIWSQDNYDNYDNIPKTFTNFDFLMIAPSDSFQKDSMKGKNPSVLNCKLATKSCKLRSCSTSSVISSREQILCLFYLGTKHVFPWDVRRWAGTGWAIHRIGTSPVRDRALQVGEGWSSMEEQESWSNRIHQPKMVLIHFLQNSRCDRFDLCCLVAESDFLAVRSATRSRRLDCQVLFQHTGLGPNFWILNLLDHLNHQNLDYPMTWLNLTQTPRFQQSFCLGTKQLNWSARGLPRRLGEALPQAAS